MTKLKSASTNDSADYEEINFPHDDTSKELLSHCRMDFYTDFDSQSYRTLDFDRTSTALNILQEYFSELPEGSCTNWAVLEVRKRLHMHRIVEDHEIIAEVRDKWQNEPDGEFNRFVVRQDYCKYEIFRNPMQFLASSMLTLPNEKAEVLDGLHPVARNSFLRSLLISNTWHPEIEGWLSLLERKNWKRIYFILRPSGLYMSTKNMCKEPKYLSLVSGLEEIGVYQVDDGQRSLDAPSDGVFCLIGVLSGQCYFKYICTKDQEMRRNWMVILRLLKYGNQMRENYTAALNIDKTLNTMCNIRDLHIEEQLKCRVPMDFSGQSGRIVVDEQEAIEALVSEVNSWKKRKATRCEDSSPSAATELSPYCSEIWYHGAITREDATQLLITHGLVDGIFLVRKSRSEPRCFSLSFTYSGKVHNQRISRIKVGEHMCFTLDGGKTKFLDLVQLVDFYHLNNGCLPTKLNYPVTSFKNPQEH